MNKKSNCNTYAKLLYFGNDAQLATDNPLTYCLETGINKDFTHAPLGVLYDPKCKECENYMVAYCGNNWDQYCDIYQNLNPAIKDRIAERQNCQYAGFNYTPFDSTNPRSPIIEMPLSKPYCNVNKYKDRYNCTKNFSWNHWGQGMPGARRC